MSNNFFGGLFNKNKEDDSGYDTPIYYIDTDDYLVLINLAIALDQGESDQCIYDTFFNEAEDKVNKLGLERLQTNGVIFVEDETVEITEAVSAQLTAIVKSFYCVSFVNSKLYQSNATIVFYYYNDIFVAVKSDVDDTVIVSGETVQEIMNFFQKELLDAKVTDDFLKAYWNNGEKWNAASYGDPIKFPSMVCTLGLGSGVLAKKIHAITMLVDDEKVQHLCIDESDPNKADCTLLPQDSYFSTISSEVEQLEIVHQLAMQKINGDVVVLVDEDAVLSQEDDEDIIDADFKGDNDEQA